MKFDVRFFNLRCFAPNNNSIIIWHIELPEMLLNDQSSTY